MQPSSFSIKRKAAASLLHSARTARALGRPLNTHVTLSLWHLGLSPENASGFFREVRERHFQRWSAYIPRGTMKPRNGDPTYTWVIEAPEGRAHVHWMLHLAAGQKRAFRSALLRWIRRRSGQTDIPDSVVNIAPVRNAEGLKLYLAKGMDPHLARLWGITHRDQGQVRGRRAGTSRNLGPAEWRPRKAAYQRSRRRAA
jgi:hypothetical protein